MLLMPLKGLQEETRPGKETGRVHPEMGEMAAPALHAAE